MRIIGHRGNGITGNNIPRVDKTHKPENTCAAFEYALSHGADGFETDLMMTADGEIVCIHDDALNLHVAGADFHKRDFGFVSKKTWGQIKNLDVGQGQNIPRLSDAFAVAARHPDSILNLEVKGKGMAEALVKEVNKLCGQFNIAHDRVVYTGNDVAQMKRMRQLDPNAIISPGVFAFFPFIFPVREGGVPRWHDPMKKSLRFVNRIYAHYHGPENRMALTSRSLDRARNDIKPQSLSIYYQEVTKDILDYAAHHNLHILAWSIWERHPDKDPSMANFVREHHNNPRIHIITDYPEEMVRLKKSLDQNGPKP